MNGNNEWKEGELQAKPALAPAPPSAQSPDIVETSENNCSELCERDVMSDVPVFLREMSELVVLAYGLSYKPKKKVRKAQYHSKCNCNMKMKEMKMEIPFARKGGIGKIH